MITIHHLEHSQSFRIVWLLEELKQPYQLTVYARDTVTSLAPETYKALHPAGTAPVITDGEHSLAETNAIIDYILDQAPDDSLRPAAHSPQRLPYLYWFHTAQGSLTPMLLMLFIFSKMTEKTPRLLRPLIAKVTEKAAQVLPQPRINRLLDYMETTLATSIYLAGETLTAADIVMVYNLEVIESRLKQANLTTDYPHIANYLNKLQQRQAYQAALAKIAEARP